MINDISCPCSLPFKFMPIVVLLPNSVLFYFVLQASGRYGKWEISAIVGEKDAGERWGRGLVCGLWALFLRSRYKWKCLKIHHVEGVPSMEVK